MTPLLVWSGLAGSFVLALAAAVRMAGPPAVGDGASGVIRLPVPVTAAILGLFGLAAIVFIVDLVWRALTQRRREDEGEPADEAPPMPTWLRRLSLILSIVNVVVLVYLWRRAVIDGGLLAGFGGLAAGLSIPVTPPASAPAIFNWAFGILAVAAGLGALALALWVALGDRLTQKPEEPADAPAPAPLEAAVGESLEDLRAEPDPRRAIVRCYARFERAAAESGVARKPWLTPMEFMREALARLPVPRAAVPTLTGLFELARFSDHALGPVERDRALAALHEIRTTMEAGDGGRGAA